ncbi:hypothetical protein Tco_0398517 [Tanacetum coccineum]
MYERTVIKECYGECGGFGTLAGSRGPNGIWCDIIKVVEDIEKIDPSFKRSFHIKVLHGANASFWKDLWCENGTRLMDLFSRRLPRGRAIGDVMSLVSTIGSLSLSSASINRWSWSKEASGIYKCRAKKKRRERESRIDDDGILDVLSLDSSVLGMDVISIVMKYQGSSEEVFVKYRVPEVEFWVRRASQDIALGAFTSNGCLLSNKAIHGVFQSTSWAIWKWRNKIIKAQQDSVDSIKEDDIFPSIHMITKIWIYARASSRPANWNY